MSTHHTVRYEGAGGLPLVGDAWGDPSHRTVLLLHGGGQTRHAWGGTARALAKDGWYAVALDLRGHGDSGWADDGDYGIDAFVADTRAVAAHFRPAPAVVGASLGGIAALLAEGEATSPLFSALVLVDIAPRMEPEGVARIVSFMAARLDGFATLEEAADSIAEYLPHRPRPKDLSGLKKNLRRRDNGRYYWHWDPRFVVGKRVPAASRNPDRLLRAARNLSIPTLLVRGRMSDIVSEDGVAEFLAAVPHATYVDVSDAGHMVAGDRNDVFSQAVRDFLRAE